MQAEKEKKTPYEIKIYIEKFARFYEIISQKKIIFLYA
jgi:hypothetical protein